jgi:hypothetical protein
MQEVWLGTEPNFLSFFATSASYAVCFTFCAEILRMIFGKFFKNPHEWNWNDLIFGGLCGILTAIAATAVCVF